METIQGQTFAIMKWDVYGDTVDFTVPKLPILA